MTISILGDLLYLVGYNLVSDNSNNMPMCCNCIMHLILHEIHVITDG